MPNGTRSNRIAQGPLLNLIQQGESHVYALLTRDGAVKIGVSCQLAVRKTHMAFGGFERFLAFVPGDYEREQVIHAAMPDDLRIGSHWEYYYPLHEHVLPVVNPMRDAMGMPPLNRRDLPRTGHWARRLPVAKRPVSWPWPQPWKAA